MQCAAQAFEDPLQHVSPSRKIADMFCVMCNESMMFALTAANLLCPPCHTSCVLGTTLNVFLDVDAPLATKAIYLYISIYHVGCNWRLAIFPLVHILDLCSTGLDQSASRFRTAPQRSQKGTRQPGQPELRRETHAETPGDADQCFGGKTRRKTTSILAIPRYLMAKTTTLPLILNELFD